jgi:hypothetical protein
MNPEEVQVLLVENEALRTEVAGLRKQLAELMQQLQAALAQIVESEQRKPDPPAFVKWKSASIRFIRRWRPCRERWQRPRLDLTGQVMGRGRIGMRVVSLVRYLRITLRLPFWAIQGYRAPRFTRCGRVWGDRPFPDDDLKDLYDPNNGRPSLPPSIMSGALLLQFHDDVSDQEATERILYDLRWKVALLAADTAGVNLERLFRLA